MKIAVVGARGVGGGYGAALAKAAPMSPSSPAAHLSRR